MFDIAQLDTRLRSENGVAMPILHPRSGAPLLDDKGAPVTITLLGPNSPALKSVVRTLQLRRAEMANRGVKMIEADYDRERFDTLMGVTIGWSFDTVDGKPFLFSTENARSFWQDGRWDWVVAQAYSYCQADGNYLPSL